jgi:hypothetical protein
VLSRYVNAKVFALNIHCNSAVDTPAKYKAGKHQVSLVEVTANALLHAFVPTTMVAAANSAGVGVVQTMFDVFRTFHRGKNDDAEALHYSSLRLSPDLAAVGPN